MISAGAEVEGRGTQLALRAAAQPPAAVTVVAEVRRVAAVRPDRDAVERAFRVGTFVDTFA